jgi:acetolactate synthase-1/2/3 large subunit
MRLSGAEIVAHILIEQGATTVFGYPGAAVLPIYDALWRHSGEIAHYITAHEQGAAHAADGFARATGRTGVVLATSGPGSTNLVTGIATAFMDSVPLVAITGNVGSTLIGKDSFQEVYTTGITLAITKHNYFVQDVSELAAVLREAFSIAAGGRPGPVLVDITKDAQAAETDFEPSPAPNAAPGTKPGADPGAEPHIWHSELPALPDAAPALPGGESSPSHNADATELAPLLQALRVSERPLVCFGGGVISANASDELADLLHKAQLPAVHSIMGTGVLAADDPLNLGLVGMHGLTSANRALEEADLLLTFGFRFSDRVALNTERWASQAKIIQIDIDHSEVDKNVTVDHAIIGDVRAVLQELLPQVTATERSLWLSRVEQWRANDYRPADSDATLKPHQVINAIMELAGDDVLITTDVGQHQMWAAQYCSRVRVRSFLTSGGLGTMGFGYGAAIGACLGTGRSRPIVHITGDGSFHMNLNEACTAATYKLPIISVIMNNQVLGMVRQWQHAFYDDHYSATTLNRVTDYVKVAEGFGLKGYRADTIAGFRSAFEAALQSGEPAWIECRIDRDEPVVPMIPTGGTVADTIV